VFVIHIVMIGRFSSFHIFCIACPGKKRGSPFPELISDMSRADLPILEMSSSIKFVVLVSGEKQQFCLEIIVFFTYEFFISWLHTAVFAALFSLILNDIPCETGQLFSSF